MKVIILAAGKSSRFQTRSHKALQDFLGKSILERVFCNVIALDGISEVVFVLGHQREKLEKEISDLQTKHNLECPISTVYQAEQLGTAHALQVGLGECGGDISCLVLNVDTPLIQTDSLASLIQETVSNQASLGVMTTVIDEPFGYGRIVRDFGDHIDQIVEEKDATSDQKDIREINSGIYYFHELPLTDMLREIRSNNAQSELYLTDIVSIAKQQNKRVVPYVCSDKLQTMGVNTKSELASLIRQVSGQRAIELEQEGVLFYDKSSCFLSPEVVIGRDTVIESNVYILGDSTVGEGCCIGQGSYIVDSEVCNDSVVKASYIYDSRVQVGASIGPFAHIRGGCIIGENVRVGNFVELKNTSIQTDTCVAHLSYLGDAELGTNVNIGAGTITANFNSITGEKHKTILKDQVKTGSNSVLVAPLNVSEGSIIGAGSVITHDVEPEYSLGIARSKQTVIPNWVKERMSYV